MRTTIPDIAQRKGEDSTPIVCLTAYTAPMAASLHPHCDILLVGDSVAMVLYGEPSTLQADIEMMIRHGRAVQNASSRALVVIDMPFGTYQESKEQAFRNAARILKETGAASIKLEGGVEMAETIAFLTARGVPVMAHIGLQPQSVHTLGGFKAQGAEERCAQKILADAHAVADAGAYAIVLEGVMEGLAREITRAVPCPVIGIGASAACDGQILVAEDMLGLTHGKAARFVKNYGGLNALIEQSAKAYADDVKARKFPDTPHLYGAQRPAEAPQVAPILPLATETEPKKPAEFEPPFPVPTPRTDDRPAGTAPSLSVEGVLRAIPRKSRDY